MALLMCCLFAGMVARRLRVEARASRAWLSAARGPEMSIDGMDEEARPRLVVPQHEGEAGECPRARHDCESITVIDTANLMPVAVEPAWQTTDGGSSALRVLHQEFSEGEPANRQRFRHRIEHPAPRGWIVPGDQLPVLPLATVDKRVSGPSEILLCT